MSILTRIREELLEIGASGITIRTEGRNIVVLYQIDEPGTKHLEAICALLDIGQPVQAEVRGPVGTREMVRAEWTPESLRPGFNAAAGA